MIIEIIPKAEPINIVVLSELDLVLWYMDGNDSCATPVGLAFS